MKKNLLIAFTAIFLCNEKFFAQEVLNPEGLLQLGRLYGSSMSSDGKQVVFSVKKYNVNTNSNSKKHYVYNPKDGIVKEITDPE